MLDLNPYKKYFKKIWVLEHKESFALKKTGPMVGDGRLEIVFVSGNGYKAIFEKEVIFCGAGIYVSGHLDQRLELEILPHTKIVSLKMEPWTASLLSNFNFQETLNKTIPLAELNSVLTAKLMAIDWENYPERIMKCLAKEVEEGLAHQADFTLIYHGSQLLERNYIDFKQAKERLLSHTRLSSRSVEMKFKQYVGLTPKKFANTIRFRKITENIYHGMSPASLTHLAYQHGYFDQAHFIRTCQQMLGMSPKLLSPEHCFITNSAEEFRYYTI